MTVLPSPRLVTTLAVICPSNGTTKHAQTQTEMLGPVLLVGESFERCGDARVVGAGRRGGRAVRAEGGVSRRAALPPSLVPILPQTNVMYRGFEKKVFGARMGLATRHDIVTQLDLKETVQSFLLSSGAYCSQMSSHAYQASSYAYLHSNGALVEPACWRLLDAVGHGGNDLVGEQDHLVLRRRRGDGRGGRRGGGDDVIQQTLHVQLRTRAARRICGTRTDDLGFVLIVQFTHARV